MARLAVRKKNTVRPVTVREFVLQHPTLHAADLVQALSAQGRKATVHGVLTTRSYLRQMGHKLPRLRAPAKKPATFVIEEIMRRNPSADFAGLQKKLAAAGIKRELGSIARIRQRMVRRGEPLSLLSQGAKPKPIPTLTPAQEELKRRSEPFVKAALWTQGRRHKFWPETLEDFESYVRQHLPSWVVNKPAKMPLPDYIRLKIFFAVKDFVRVNMKVKLGLPLRDIRYLGSLIAGSKKGETPAQTARRIGISAKEANALLQAYETYRRQLSLDALEPWKQ